MLADRCDELLAVDVSERAVAAASERLSGQGHVRVERRTLPEEMPAGPFDLIVASEVLYYFPGEEMLAVLRGFERELAPGGALLAVHWRRETKTYPLQGDEVHELLSAEHATPEQRDHRRAGLPPGPLRGQSVNPVSIW